MSFELQNKNKFNNNTSKSSMTSEIPCTDHTYLLANRSLILTHSHVIDVHLAHIRNFASNKSLLILTTILLKFKH